jgi:peroxiredoxin
MKDVSFKTYQNDNLSEVSAETLFKNKTVLVCSIMQVMGKGTSNLYLQYLQNIQKNYKALGIDEIHVVNSTNNIWLLPKVTAFFPRLIPLIDHEKKFVKLMREYYPLAVQPYVQHFPYQVLIKDVVVQKIYTPEAKDFKNYEFFKKILIYLKNNSFKVNIINSSEYKNFKQEKMIEGINRYIKMLKDANQKYYDYRDIEHTFDRAFFYYNLWPNIQLEKYLKNLV